VTNDYGKKFKFMKHERFIILGIEEGWSKSKKWMSSGKCISAFYKEENEELIMMYRNLIQNIDLDQNDKNSLIMKNAVVYRVKKEFFSKLMLSNIPEDRIKYMDIKLDFFK